MCNPNMASIAKGYQVYQGMADMLVSAAEYVVWLVPWLPASLACVLVPEPDSLACQLVGLHLQTPLASLAYSIKTLFLHSTLPFNPVLHFGQSALNV
jgi:hypothetical protein